jgi:hypothetical protein
LHYLCLSVNFFLFCSWLPCVYPEYLVKANQDYEYRCVQQQPNNDWTKSKTLSQLFLLYNDSLWLVPLSRRSNLDQDVAAFANEMRRDLPKQ